MNMDVQDDLIDMNMDVQDDLIDTYVNMTYAIFVASYIGVSSRLQVPYAL
jgi:hypothetical protein